MRGERGGSENDGEAEADLGFAEAAQAEEQRRGVGVCAAQREEVAGAKGENQRGEDNFGRQQQAVRGSNHARPRSGVEPGETGAGEDERGDADEGHDGKATAHAARNCGVGGQLEGDDEKRQGADPCGHAEMVHRGKDEQERPVIHARGGVAEGDRCGQRDHNSKERRRQTRRESQQEEQRQGAAGKDRSGEEEGLRGNVVHADARAGHQFRRGSREKGDLREDQSQRKASGHAAQVALSINR